MLIALTSLSLMVIKAGTMIGKHRISDLSLTGNILYSCLTTLLFAWSNVSQFSVLFCTGLPVGLPGVWQRKGGRKRRKNASFARGDPSQSWNRTTEQDQVRIAFSFFSLHSSSKLLLLVLYLVVALVWSYFIGTILSRNESFLSYA